MTEGYISELALSMEWASSIFVVTVSFLSP